MDLGTGEVTDENDQPYTYITADITDPLSCSISVNYFTTKQLGKWRCDIESEGLDINTQVGIRMTQRR